MTPRLIPKKEYLRVRAELEQRVSEGKMNKRDAERRLWEMRTANTKYHVEKSVKEGKTTRAEADALYKKLGGR